MWLNHKSHHVRRSHVEKISRQKFCEFFSNRLRSTISVHVRYDKQKKNDQPTETRLPKSNNKKSEKKSIDKKSNFRYCYEFLM